MSIIFANFWTWLGAVILAGTVLNGVAEIVKAVRLPKRRIKVYRHNGGTMSTEIDCASAEDFIRIAQKVTEANFAGGQKEEPGA